MLSETDCEVLAVSRSVQKSALFLGYLENPTDRLEFFQADLNQNLEQLNEKIDQFQPDYIVNFAAQSEVGPSWENPDHWFQTNAVAMTRLFHLLKDKKYLKKYVHISSPEVYGTCEGQVYEDAPLNPSTPYAASKAAGDLSLFTYYKNFQFPFVMIRATNVYGARQQLFKIMPRSVIYIKMGKTIELHGGGAAVKSFIHIRDVSRAELKAMFDGKIGAIYHISPDQGVSVKDVVSTICQKMGADFSLVTRVVEERLGQDAAYVINSDKVRSELSWAPQITLAEGIAGLVRWVDQYWDEIQKEPLLYQHKQ